MSEIAVDEIGGVWVEVPSTISGLDGPRWCRQNSDEYLTWDELIAKARTIDIFRYAESRYAHITPA